MKIGRIFWVMICNKTMMTMTMMIMIMGWEKQEDITVYSPLRKELLLILVCESEYLERCMFVCMHVPKRKCLSLASLGQLS